MINELISSKYQTKEWRLNQQWYINGKHNECEKYQIEYIEKIFNSILKKTNDRIYIDNYTIIDKKYYLKYDNGYEYTENFDGKIIINEKIYYINLKFVCDNGGSQQRTLKDVYNFIKCQLENILIFNSTNIYFINILDGNTCFNNMHKFKYLINKEKYLNIKKYIYIGDLYEFYHNKCNIIL